jgi:hypothetical protein
LTVDRLDPRNARYLVPLQDTADEALAHEMADAITFDGDADFEQALIDSRRMLCDPAYEELFSDMEARFRDLISAPLARRELKRPTIKPAA